MILFMAPLFLMDCVNFLKIFSSLLNIFSVVADGLLKYTDREIFLLLST
ncbi:hypothetical protein HMPREF9444_00196 [Succinatimonas hippei YIT 12066]|uniref:Uncharacterized protein n=1 Tax=Succinatimonas hippei (strain DSM 22608 / JCM 16073 / KCTC 15190 / YIT 12066) TaxID=762983 RepID=E8LHP1_SUCHY|nr:hypothetical protein HMPREF9444_00196 [Succinatimonas hippei YIT 12066]